MRREENGDEARSERPSLSEEQLGAFAHGWAATIMPCPPGWKVQYFSSPDFSTEPGTYFASFDAALDAVASLLPQVNSPEERARALRDLAERIEARGDDEPASHSM